MRAHRLMVLLFNALEDSAHWAEAARTIRQWTFAVTVAVVTGILFCCTFEGSLVWFEIRAGLLRQDKERARGLNARVTSHKQTVYELGSTFLDRQEVTSRTQ
jgi:hypothetical protein